MERPHITDSARKNGIADEDTLHAFNNPIIVREHDLGFTMVFGTGRNGVTWIEVGYVIGEEDGAVVIVHSMETNDKRMRW